MTEKDFKKGSFLVLLTEPRPSGYVNCVLDDPIYHIRSLDPRLRIIENIMWKYEKPFTRDEKEAFEVFIETHEQFTKVEKYLSSEEFHRFHMYYAYDEDKNISKAHMFRTRKLDYRKSREVGHILFVILSMCRFKYPKLQEIGKGSYHIEVLNERKIKNGEVMEIKYNCHIYRYCLDNEFDLFLEEDGFFIETFDSIKTHKWYKLKSSMIPPLESGDISEERAMSITNGLKPNIFNTK